MTHAHKQVILLVEDDHDSRVTIRQTLENAGHFVLSAPNGSDALKILNRQRPDLIILDMIMPLMDGEEFLRAKERDDRLRNLPVLLISADEEKIEVHTSHPHMKKPFDMDVFLEKISQVLAKKMDPA